MEISFSDSSVLVTAEICQGREEKKMDSLLAEVTQEKGGGGGVFNCMETLH